MKCKGSICLLSLFFLLSGCHSTKKAISKESAKETRQIEGVVKQIDSIKSDAVKKTIAIDSSKRFKSIQQFTQSVTEKYDTVGRITERKTIITKSQLREKKQADKSEATIDKKQVSDQRQKSTDIVKTTSKKDESYHKDIDKKRGLGIWVEIGIIIPILAGLFSIRKSWLPAVIRAIKWILKFL